MIVWLAACSGGGDGVDPEVRRQVLDDLTQVVAPEYTAFAERADALSTAADAFCAAPDADGLAAVRQAWWDAREPWKRTEVVQFGPVVAQPWRLGPPIDFWPVRAGVVDDLLAGDAELTPASVGALGASARGFPVIEYLLWGPGDDTLGVTDPRRCAYVTALSADLASNAHTLVTAWDGTRTALVDPADVPDDPWMTPQDVIDEWVNRAFFTVENLRHEKLGKPFGDSSGGEPLPDALESRYSGRSLQDARDVYAGVELVLDGGITDLLPEDRQNLLPELTTRREAVRAAFEGVPEPLEGAIVDARPTVRAAQDALRDLQVALQVDLAQALSVTITFNDNDGD